VLCTPQRALKNVILLAALLVLPIAATAATVGNPLCPGEEVSFNPDNGQDIVLPEGFKVSVFAKDLNFPTGIAFRGASRRFEVYVVEAGRFPTSRCNDGVAWQTKGLPGNPFTSDIRVFDQDAKLLRTLGKPKDAAIETADTLNGAVDIAFERGFDGGRLFATDNESSRSLPGCRPARPDSWRFEPAGSTGAPAPRPITASSTSMAASPTFPARISP